MKGKAWRQILSFVLAVIFVLELVPASALAIGSATEPTAEATELTASEAAYVVGEVDDLREETVKHFRMNDGAFMAVQYSSPVHYQDADGEWQDIDNTLQRVGERYVSQNGAMTKSFAAALDSGLLFETSYQGYTVGMSLVTKLTGTTPVQPGLEIMEEISKEMEADLPAEEIAAEETPTEGEQAVQEETIREVIASPTEAQAETEAPAATSAAQEGAAAAPAGEEQPQQELARFARVEAKNVKAQVENPEAIRKVAGTTSTEQMITPEKLTSDIRFANVYENTDLVYQNHGYDIKESVIIKRQQDTYSYSFALNLGGLTPTMEEDGSVLLSNADGEGIFEIPAPYLRDANGALSGAAEYILTETDGGWVLTVEANPEWMNAEERVFPVTLDPTILLKVYAATTATYIRSNAPSGTARDANNGSDSGDRYCGLINDSQYGTCQVFVEITSLPTLPKNCVPVNILLQRCHEGFYDSNSFSPTVPAGSLTVEAHEWNGSINSIADLTWSAVYQGTSEVDDTVLDFQVLSKSTLYSYPTWDITNAAIDWYTDGSSRHYIALIPTDHATNQRAADLTMKNSKFIVQYRNPVGLEDYYTYQEASAGKAGNVYISDFKQEMTVDHTDVSFSSEATPYTLRHVYNTATAGVNFGNNTTFGIHSCNFSSMKFGNGWKLSAQQTVVPQTIEEINYLIYNDEDGTEHYFQETSTNTYEDEDGLGLKIVKSTSGSNTIYTMTDTDVYHTWVFHNGYLISLTDSNSNAIYFAYNNAYSSSSTSWKPTTGTTNKLVQIVVRPNASDSTPIKIASFAYSSDGYLQTLTDYAGRATTYTYSNGNLTKITYPDNTTVTYQYSGLGGRMSELYDGESRYGVTVSYQERLGGSTVHKVAEFAVDSSGSRLVGNAFHAHRNSIHLTSYRFYGADHTAETEDDIITYCVLDHYGKTINTYDLSGDRTQMLGVTAAAYTKNSSTSAKNNRLTGAAAMGQSAINLLENSGMEIGGERSATSWKLNNWGFSNVSAFGGTVSDPADINTRTGNGALKCWIGTADTAPKVAVVQKLWLTAERTYTLSGYINTGDISTFASGSGVYLAFLTSAQVSDAAQLKNVTAKSEIIDYKTSGDIDNGWERVSVTFKPTATGTYYAAFVQDNAEGISYCDDLQLEAAAAASGANLLQDGIFNLYYDTHVKLRYWTQNRYQYAVDKPMGQSVGNSMTAVGGTNGDTQMNQVVPVNKSAADTTFILSGWGKANSVAGTVTERTTGEEKYFGLIAVIKYTDGTTENHYVSFNDDFTDWQFASGIVVPKQSTKTIDTITVHCAYNYNANRAYFTNISLIREPVQTYSYDEKGNPVAATDGNAKTAYEYFSGTSKLKSYTTPSGTKHTLEYSGNNLSRDTLAGVSQNYSYSSAGNLTQNITRKGYTGDYIASYNKYTNNEQFKTVSQDVNGIETNYSYSGTTRNLLSVENAEETTQNYTYYANTDRRQMSYISRISNINYSYSNGMLNMFERRSFPVVGNTENNFWQRYLLQYDAFGNTSSISVTGSTTGTSFAPEIRLASYAYETSVDGVSVKNGRLAAMTYANGDTVSYTYDPFDRTTAETYNDGTTNHYIYASDGSLARQYATNRNNAATEQYSYQYDSLGRLIHSREQNGAGTTVLTTEHVYDTSNRLKSQSWRFGSGSAAYQQVYTYSDKASGNDTLTTLKNTMSAGADTITYAYSPNVRQLTSKTTSGAGNFTRTYTYRTLGTERKTAQVETTAYNKANGARILGYEYTYNALGNISSIYKSTAAGTDNDPTWVYTYDTLGQLTGVDDYDAEYFYSYTYDTAGNLRSMNRVKMETDSVKFCKYYYDNAAWKDLLTAVQVNATKKSITYPTDASGNVTAGTPLTWYNGFNYTFTWKKGTQLASAAKGSVTTTYDYDMSGVRGSKTVESTNGSTTYNYQTLSGLVMRQTWGAQTLDFVYDDSNQPYALIYKSSSTATPVLYYYVLNQQGDVMALMNTSGAIVAQYQYDPWGVPTVQNPSGTTNTSSTFIGNINPLRYRGYYYDTETGFYYLQSRYYDPAIGRFISADTFATTDCNGFLSANMFAYCENNPVNRSDPSGEFFNTVIGAVVGATIGAISAAITGDNIWGGLASGAASGAIAGLGVDIAIATVATGPVGIAAAATSTFFLGGAGSLLGDAIEAKSNGRSFQLDGESLGRAAISGAVNTFTGGLNTVVGKATGEVFNKSLTLKSVARSIWKSSSNLIKRSARVSRIFGVDSTVKLTIIQRMSTRIFSGRRR